MEARIIVSGRSGELVSSAYLELRHEFSAASPRLVLNAVRDGSRLGRTETQLAQLVTRLMVRSEAQRRATRELAR